MNSLPQEWLEEIFSHLELRDLANCCRTNVRWRQIAKNNRAWIDVLQTPYEIGQFITAQIPALYVPRLDEPYVVEAAHFAKGPDPLFYQMKQGLILRTQNFAPTQIYTRYGSWTVLIPYSGNFEKVLEVIKKTLNLQYIPALSHAFGSCWAIQSWQDKHLEEPIMASNCNNKYIPNTIVKAAYEKFQERHSPQPPEPKKRKLMPNGQCVA